MIFGIKHILPTQRRVCTKYIQIGSQALLVSKGISSYIFGIKKETSHLDVGANTLKIFASSEEALRPDVYDTSFLIVEGQDELPIVAISEVEVSSEDTSYAGIASIIIGAIIVGIIVYVRKKRKT